ncbi:SOS response-associated peptidase family protein [Sporichthya polymorpha]|uniref:SOS response-associated peptidase family protein n=1 Tax=Sporichthya polymorpha TaxID=35751 RepID=UPI00048C4EAF
MCGRYGASWGVDDLVAEFDLDSVDVPVSERLEADYNVAPTKPVYAVVTRRGRDEPAEAEATRRLATLRWGLVPFWAKDPKIGARMINARIETAAEKPAFREAFAKRRCLLPADGYYEWYTPTDGAAKKQPFFIRRRGGGVLAMAGLYEFWRDPTKDRDDPDAWWRTCTVITTTASDAIGEIHDRQPMFVEPGAWADWLSPEQSDPDALRGLLVPSPGDGLEAYPVSTAVNNHRNNGPELVVPLEHAEPQTLF